MQSVHPDDDLLERSRGDDAREDGAAGREILSCRGEAWTGAAEMRHQSFVWQDAPFMSPLGKRAAELVGVPAPSLPRAENRDPHGR